MTEEKTKDYAAGVIKLIEAEVNKDVIKDYEIPTLCNFDTAEETGFAVILTLSNKFDYTNKVLDMWKDRLLAADYMISVRRNQLRVRFNVMYDKEKELC